MRKLSKEERELITGGIRTMRAVDVHASSFWGAIGYNEIFHDSFFYQVFDDYWSEQDNGGGNDAPLCRSHEPSTVDQYVDQLASKAARDIRAQSDHNRREYLVIVYRDGHGMIQSSPLVAGANNGASATADLQSLGIPAAQIVGLVHNHPRDVYGTNSTSAIINRHPSSGDWETADRIIAAGANSSVLTLYILGPDGLLREYDYAAKSIYNPPRTSTPNGGQIDQSLVPADCN